VDNDRPATGAVGPNDRDDRGIESTEDNAEVTELNEELDLWAAKGALGMIGQRLQETRQALGLSTEFLASRAEVEPDLVEAIERGEGPAQVDVIIRVASILGLDTAQIFADIPLRDVEQRIAIREWHAQIDRELPSYEELLEAGVLPVNLAAEWKTDSIIPTRRARLYEAAGFNMEQAHEWEVNASEGQSYEELEQTLLALVTAKIERGQQG